MKKRIDNINKPPEGTKITVQNGLDDSVIVFYPNQGVNNLMISRILYTLFFIGFLAVWNFIVDGGGFLSVFFSLPFWLTGLVMICKIINAFFETQSLILTKTSLTLKKNRPIKPKNIKIKIKDIQSIRMNKLNMENPIVVFSNLILMFNSFGMGEIKQPAIISSRKTEYFFEEASETEQEWVTTNLDSIIKNKK